MSWQKKRFMGSTSSQTCVTVSVLIDEFNKMEAYQFQETSKKSKTSQETLCVWTGL